MELHDLKPAPGSTRERKRVGRGHGSGSVKTAGRGTKGQKSRSGGRVRPGFEGGQNPIYQRMPYKRGFKNFFKKEFEIINVGMIEEFGLESPITPESLHERGVIRTTNVPLKVLGDGEISARVEIHAHKFSASAREKIEAAGGKAEVID
ncbi:MAG: 50S ribosomal protein L15 [Thermomicrobiales bacterium]